MTETSEGPPGIAFFPICRHLHQSKAHLCEGTDFCFHLLPSEVTCSSMNKWCAFQELKHFVACLEQREQWSARGYVLIQLLVGWLIPNGRSSLCILSTAPLKGKSFTLAVRMIMTLSGIVKKRHPNVPWFQLEKKVTFPFSSCSSAVLWV